MKKVCIDPIGHERHHRLSIATAAQNFLARQRAVGLVGHQLAMWRQQLQDLIVYSVSYNEFRQHVLSYLKRLRSTPLKASTSVTMARMTSRIAATSWYCMMRSEPMSSKPIPPAPTMPITVEARKLYSQR